MTKKAAIYSRVSTAEQAEDDKTSLVEQERLCREYCQTKDYGVSALYQDIGSGTIRKRPSFLEMLKEARQGLFEVIIGLEDRPAGQGHLSLLGAHGSH